MKKYLIIIMLLSLFLFGCSNQESGNNGDNGTKNDDVKVDFDLSVEALQEVFGDGYTIRERETGDYLVVTPDEKFLCSVKNSLVNGKLLQFDFLHSSNPSAVVIHSDRFEEIFKCFSNLSNLNYKEIYDEFLEFTKLGNEQVLYFKKRIGNNVVSVYVYPKDDKGYTLRMINVMDDVFLHGVIEKNKANWEEILKRWNITSLKDIKLDDVENINEKTAGFIIEGQLVDISESDFKADESLIKYGIPKEERFLKAKLNGRNVLIRNLYLSKEELEKRTKHYMFYFKDTDTLIINFSI